MLARPKQVQSQAQPLQQRSQSSHHQPVVRTLPYSCPHHHMMTLLHLTSDHSHNILCVSVVQLSSVLLPGVGRRPLGSRERYWKIPSELGLASRELIVYWAGGLYNEIFWYNWRQDCCPQTESESLCDCQRIVQRYAMIWMILWWWLEL